MKIKVVYHSMTGNTRKVAEAIARAANVRAEEVGRGDVGSEDVDLLFIGDGVYFGSVGKAIKKYIAALDGGRVKKAAVFSTFGGVDKAGDTMRDLLGKKGIVAMNEGFSCKGQSWLILNRNRPNENDLEQAGAFALRIIRDLS